MKKLLIGALLASAFAVPTFASEPTSTPLRNDLRSNEAGVKNADSNIVVTQERIQVPSTTPSTQVVVEPRSGASATTGSSPTIATSALICSDTRLSAKEQADCSSDMLKATTGDEQMTVHKRYEARLTQTPLRNDLKSNEAGVKGAVQPSSPPSN
ncbi:MAG: hypothetical protein AB7I36_07740 [Rhodospirillaceae bacterium]